MAKLNGDTVYYMDNVTIQIAKCKIVWQKIIRKSTVILSSNDVITCYVIVDVANFDLRSKNPRSAPELIQWHCYYMYKNMISC